jgi:TrpR-related protein YerC/YecD
MSNNVASVWKTSFARQLAEVLVTIDDQTAMQSFLRDVMTEKEIIEISARLEAARMLAAGKTYTEIIEKTKLSSRTIARIRDWMQNGAGGYKPVIERLDQFQGHISPVLR